MENQASTITEAPDAVPLNHDSPNVSHNANEEPPHTDTAASTDQDTHQDDTNDSTPDAVTLDGSTENSGAHDLDDTEATATATETTTEGHNGETQDEATGSYNL